ncbi:kinase [Alphaproteobacteria bacterium]|nr:kinase [Alphaproteobacteria bacterium]
MSIVACKTPEGEDVSFDSALIGQGGMKDVYMGVDKSYVVAFFRDPLDPQSKERLKAITGPYRDGIFKQEGGAYWKEVFCWPRAVIELGGRAGIVVPAYDRRFFFQYGSINNDFLGIKGKEKEGKWFASASNRSKYLAGEEKGNWLSYLRISLALSRAVRRLHAAGLAHSDLSYKNVLLDPATGGACIIDIDGLVVPGKFPPDVVGTPDFIAPEVVATQHLSKNDPNRALPSTLTDRHALAVLIYMYLFYRHPLRGAKVHDVDPTRDEEMTMGERALFIEHPTNASNRVRADQLTAAQLPWADPARTPCMIAGPILADLFRRAFIDGLHNPQDRPTPSEWENALVRTIDMAQPCLNRCEMGWYIFDNTTRPVCPCCGAPHQGALPVLNLYSSRHSGIFLPDNHRVMVWDGQSLFPWHVNRLIFPNERLAEAQKKRVGYFQKHQGEWYLANEAMEQMYDVANKRDIPVGDALKLEDGMQILLSREEGGRLLQVQMAGG